MNIPLVSVIMASYNNDKWLPEAINSVLKQTYKNYELIITDNGSTDSSPLIIKSFANNDSRIKGIFHKNNLGISRNRNSAIMKSRGKYIAIVDSDDICLPSRFSEQVTYMEKHPEIGVLGTKWYTFTNDPNIYKKGNIKNNNVKAGRVPVHNPTTLIRKDVFENFGLFDPDIRYCEDVELYFRWYGQGVIFKNINRYLTKYRVSHGNNTGENIKALLYWQLFKLNILAFTKYKIKYSPSGYIYTLELFLYWIYCYLGLNNIYRISSSSKR